MVIELSDYAQGAIRRLADIQHYYPDSKGNYVRSGTFKDWATAESSLPELGTFRSVWEDVERESQKE